MFFAHADRLSRFLSHVARFGENVEEQIFVQLPGPHLGLPFQIIWTARPFFLGIGPSKWRRFSLWWPLSNLKERHLVQVVWRVRFAVYSLWFLRFFDGKSAAPVSEVAQIEPRPIWGSPGTFVVSLSPEPPDVSADSHGSLTIWLPVIGGLDWWVGD